MSSSENGLSIALTSLDCSVHCEIVIKGLELWNPKDPVISLLGHLGLRGLEIVVLFASISSSIHGLGKSTNLSGAKVKSD